MSASHRIDELGLRVTSALAGRDDELVRAAEDLTRAVLARAADLLEARAPGRVIRLRALPIRWRLGEDALAGDAEIEELAAALARDLEQRLPAPADRPDPEGDAAVFVDEAHHLAASLASLARGERAWYQAEEIRIAEPLAALATPGRAEVAHAVLADLARMGAVEYVLARAAPAVVALLAECLEVAVGAASVGAVMVSLSTAPAWPLSGPDAPPEAAIQQALIRHAHAQPRATAAPTAPAGPPTRRLATADPAPAPTSAARLEHAAPAREAAAIAPSRTESSPSHAAAASAGSIADAAARSSVTGAAPSRIPTQYAGLFYLLNPILEVDLPEALWCACLPEGEILGHAAAALIGDPGDAAPEHLAGCALDRALPDVAPAQHEEIATTVVAAIAGALPRRGLATIPPVELVLADHAAGRLLVASAASSPFALFAWPAATADDAARGVTAFLGAWPAGAPVFGHGAIVSLDPRGRIRPVVASAHARLIPDAPSPASAALLAQVIGVPCQLIAARTRDYALTAAALVARLAQPGSIVDRDDRLEVYLAPDAVDVAIRSAGLDRDPGWCTWLQREVRFHFGG